MSEEKKGGWMSTVIILVLAIVSFWCGINFVYYNCDKEIAEYDYFCGDCGEYFGDHFKFCPFDGMELKQRKRNYTDE